MTMADTFPPQNNDEAIPEGASDTIDQLRGRIMELAIERDVLIAELGEALYERFKDDPHVREGLESYFDSIDQIDQQGAFISDQIAQLQVPQEEVRFDHEATSEAAPEVEPEVAPEVETEAAPEVEPGVVPEVDSGFAVAFAPEPAVVPAPEIASEPAFEVVPPSAPAGEPKSGFAAPFEPAYAPVPASVPESMPAPQVAPVCAVCGTVLGTSDRFCYECGTPVAPPAVEPEPAVPVAYVCAMCGAAMNLGDRFCMTCGSAAAIEQPEPPMASAPEPMAAPEPQFGMVADQPEESGVAIPTGLDPDDDITILLQDARQVLGVAPETSSQEPSGVEDDAQAQETPAYAQPVDPSEDVTVLLQDSVVPSAAGEAPEPQAATPVAFDDYEAPTQLLQSAGDATLGGDSGSEQSVPTDAAPRPAFCMNCGAPSGETDLFCGSCGSKL